MKLLNKALLYLPYSIKRRPRINAAAINKITNKQRPRINAAPNQKNASTPEITPHWKR